MNFKIVVVLSTFIMGVFISCNEEISSSSGTGESEVTIEAPNDPESIQNNTALPESWTTYKNDRFNFCLQYPENQFRAKGEQQNSDGNTFISSDGKVELKVYAYHNVLEQSIKEIHRSDLQNNPERKVRKEDIRDKWYMLAGEKNGREFIEKRVLDNGEIKVIEATFPPDQSLKYQQVVNDIFNAFPLCVK